MLRQSSGHRAGLASTIMAPALLLHCLMPVAERLTIPATWGGIRSTGRGRWRPSTGGQCTVGLGRQQGGQQWLNPVIVLMGCPVHLRVDAQLAIAGRCHLMQQHGCARPTG